MLCPSYQVSKPGLEGTQTFWLLIQHVLTRHPWTQYFHLELLLLPCSCLYLGYERAKGMRTEHVPQRPGSPATIQAHLILLRFHFTALHILHLLTN